MSVSFSDSLKEDYRKLKMWKFLQKEKQRKQVHSLINELGTLTFFIIPVKPDEDYGFLSLETNCDL